MRFRTIAVGMSMVGVVAACGGSDRTRIDVFAASSLVDVFEVVEREIESVHDVDVVVSVGGSSSLAAQIIDGAPADVFAAADVRTMDLVYQAGLVLGTPSSFAANRLTIAVEAGNPLGVAGLADLADVDVVLAAGEVPAGRYAGQVLELAGVELSPVSYEQSVRSAAAKVALGEADAAIVYVTDVLARADELDAVAIVDEHQVDIQYPIAMLSGSPEESVLVVDAMLVGAGRAALAEAGFELP